MVIFNGYFDIARAYSPPVMDAQTMIFSKSMTHQLRSLSTRVSAVNIVVDNGVIIHDHPKISQMCSNNLEHVQTGIQIWLMVG